MSIHDLHRTIEKDIEEEELVNLQKFQTEISEEEKARKARIQALLGKTQETLPSVSPKNTSLHGYFGRNQFFNVGSKTKKPIKPAEIFRGVFDP